MKLLISRTFRWWEMSLLKLCLISLGILLGLYYFPYLIDFLLLWWGLFIVTAGYFITRFLKEK